MEDRIANAHPASELSTQARLALVVSGLWLRVGFIGACGLAAGLHMLFYGETKPLSAVALAVGGAVIAAFSWRRARAALDRADAAVVVTPSGATPARAFAGA